MASAARFLLRKSRADKMSKGRGKGGHAIISANVDDVVNSAIQQTEKLAERLGLSVSECVSRWDLTLSRADASRRAGNPVEDLLSALARLGAGNTCQRVFSWAESHNVALRERAYLAVLQAQSKQAGPRRDSAQLCWDMVHRMREHGITPTAHTYNVLLTIAARARPVDRSTLAAIRAGMEETGIEPTHVSYLMLITAYGRIKPTPDLESAKQCWKELLDLEERAPARIEALRVELQQLPAAEQALDASLDAWIAAGGDSTAGGLSDHAAPADPHASEVARLWAEVERWQERVAGLQAAQSQLQDLRSGQTPRSFTTKRIAMAKVASYADPPDVALVEEILGQLEDAGQSTAVVEGLLASAAEARQGDSILQVRNWLRSLVRAQPRGPAAARRIRRELWQRLHALVATGRWDPLEVERPLTVIMTHLAKLHLPETALELFIWMQERQQGVRANRYHLSPVLKALAQARMENSAELIESAIDRFCASNHAARAASEAEAGADQAAGAEAGANGVVEPSGDSDEQCSKGLQPDVVHFTYLLTVHSRRMAEEVVDGRSTWVRDPDEQGIWRAVEKMASVGIQLDDRAMAVVLRALRWRQGGAASLHEARDAIRRVQATSGGRMGSSSRLELLELAALDPRGEREVEAQLDWFRENARGLLPSAETRLASAQRHAGQTDRPAANVKDSWSRRLAVPSATPSLPYTVDRLGGGVRGQAPGERSRLNRRLAAVADGADEAGNDMDAEGHAKSADGRSQARRQPAATPAVNERAPGGKKQGGRGMRPVLRLLRSADK